MLTFLSLAFAAKPAPVPWAGPTKGESIRIVVVGSLPDDDQALATDVLSLDPDLIVFNGLDARHDLEAWRGPHGVVATSNKRPTKAFLNRFVGIGVDGRATPYGTLDLNSGDTRWRILYATTYPEPLARWNEQQFWTPRAAAQAHYDRLFLLLDSPVHTQAVEASQAGARIVLDDVQDVTKPIAMPLVVAGNTGTNEAYLPGGRFGELHLVAGNSGVAPGTTSDGASGWVRMPDPAPGIQQALPSAGVGGYWVVDLHEGNVDLRFKQQNETGWTSTYRLLRDNTGWHQPNATQAP